MSDEQPPEEHPGRKKRGGRHGISTKENVVEGVFAPREPEASPATVPPPGQPDWEGDDRVRARLRLGKRWTEIFTDVKNGDYTWEEFVAALDDEELARAQLRDKNGAFRGRPPTMIPRAFYNACVRELMRRGSERWRVNYVGAIDVMTQLAQDGRVKPETRLKAAQFVVERIEGKVPERVIVTEEDPWQTAIDGILTEVENGKVASAHQYLARREQGDGSEG